MSAGLPPAAARFRLDASLRAVARDVLRSREVLWVLTRRQLRARYAHHALGVAWTFFGIVIPLAVLLVLRRHIGRVPDGISSIGFLASGIVCWQFFTTSINDGASSLVSDSGILKRITVAREVIPLSRVGLACVTSGLTAAVFLSVGWLHGDFVVSVRSLATLLVVAIGMLALVAGMTLGLSVAVVGSRDLRQVITVVLQFGIFYSPILYPLEDIPGDYRNAYLVANPIGGYIDTVRQAIVFDAPVDWGVLGIALGASAAAVVLGTRAFRRWLPEVIDLA